LSVGLVGISGGTLKAPTGTLSVAGSFINSGGTFNANGGTVVLNGTNQSLSRATTFNNLTQTAAAADTLTFAAGAPNKPPGTGTLTAPGPSGNLLALRSATPRTQGQIDPQGGRSVSFVDVKDSLNVNATAITAPNSVDSGNNTNWVIGGNLVYDSTGGKL